MFSVQMSNDPSDTRSAGQRLKAFSRELTALAAKHGFTVEAFQFQVQAETEVPQSTPSKKKATR